MLSMWSETGKKGVVHKFEMVGLFESFGLVRNPEAMHKCNYSIKLVSISAAKDEISSFGTCLNRTSKYLHERPRAVGNGH